MSWFISYQEFCSLIAAIVQIFVIDFRIFNVVTYVLDLSLRIRKRSFNFAKRCMLNERTTKNAPIKNARLTFVEPWLSSENVNEMVNLLNSTIRWSSLQVH